MSGRSVIIENRWTWGNIAQIVTLVITIIGVGIAIGSFGERLVALERSSTQSNQDSRTLIKVEEQVSNLNKGQDAMREEVSRIAESIYRIERAASLASSPVSICPTEKPVLVASHCRTLPMLD